MSNLIGIKFGRLTVLELLGKDSYSHNILYCQCKCGKFTEIRENNLRSGKTKSCGCKFQELVTKHGLSKTPEYSIYNGMVQRCYNLKHKNYPDYGGRGISVWDKWRNDFKSFYDWCQENGYKKGLQIDRIDNDGNYCPENCRFVTCRENILNKRLIMSTNTSGYCGVSQNKTGKYRSHIKMYSEQIYLGTFDTAREAAIARDKFIIKNNLTKDYKLQVLTND